MSFCLVIGRWILSFSLSRSTDDEVEEEAPPLSCNLAFGFQPPAEEE
jgi:hypothetical protein